MEEYIKIEDFKLWTFREGEGEYILFCHGGPGLWDYLKPVSDMVSNTFTVLRYEQRGCGRSGGNFPYTVDANVEDIEALRQYWNIEKFILVGHSWGANLALAYALKYPDRVRSVVYLCGTGISNDWNPEFKQNWSARLTNEQKERIDILKDKLKHANARNWEEMDMEYCNLAWSPDFSNRSNAVSLSQKLLKPGFHPNYQVNDLVWSDWKWYIQQPILKESVNELFIPFLVVAGSDDPRPAKYLKEFADLLRQGTFVEVKNAGHYPWMEDYNSAATAINNFLK